MSRARAYSYNESMSTIAVMPSYHLSAVPQTETLNNVVDASPRTESTFDALSFFDKRAGLAATLLHSTKQIFAHASLVSRQPAFMSFFEIGQLDLDLEHDIWVDMPPLFRKKVVMRVRYAGQGEPHPILGPLAEE